MRLSHTDAQRCHAVDAFARLQRTEYPTQRTTHRAQSLVGEMSDRVKALLAQYETKLRQAEAERELKNSARLAFNHRAETALTSSVKPVLARLATELKDAGHKAWTHGHYWVSEEPKGEYTNVQIYCRLKSIRPDADNRSIAFEPEASSVRFTADLDKLVIVVVARAGPSEPRGLPTSTMQEMALEQISEPRVQDILVEWLQRLIESSDPGKD